MKSIQPLLISYFLKIHQEILWRLTDWDGILEEEWLHQLRVNLKRIRYVHSIMKRCGARHSKKLFKHYQKLFNWAGKIRAHHVSLYRIKKHALETEAEEAQQKFQTNSLKTHQKFNKTIGLFLAKAPARLEEIKIEFEHTAAVSPEEFLSDLKDRVQEIATSTLPLSKWHRSRKLLKEVVYSTELSEAIKKHIENSFHLKTIVVLEDAIGDWHDLKLLLKKKNPLKPALQKESQKNLKSEYRKERDKVKLLLPQILVMEE